MPRVVWRCLLDNILSIFFIIFIKVEELKNMMWKEYDVIWKLSDRKLFKLLDIFSEIEEGEVCLILHIITSRGFLGSQVVSKFF